MTKRIFAIWRAHGLHPVRSSIGALIAIICTATISAIIMGDNRAMPFIVASMGASSVLAFAVPASPLAQPRSIIGGNIISGLAGVTVHKLIGHDPIIAMGCASALAIYAMHKTRCIHPPGGAVAMIAVMGGPVIEQAGYGFVLFPVALNSVLLVGIALLFNNFAGSRYPHRPEVLPEHAIQPRTAFDRQDIAAVLDELEDLPDIAIEDLEAIFSAVEARAAQRLQPAIARSGK